MICNNMRIIGLTGGIASGKSRVADFFSKKGLTIIDADQLARDAVAPGTPILERIISLFGISSRNEDGTLNRSYVREQIFTDSDKRKQLEAIVHPEIKRLSQILIRDVSASGQKNIIYMAPLLIEAGALDRVDEVWLVTLRPEIQLLRLMLRDNLSADAAQRIICSQMPLAEKERYADVLIDNNGTFPETVQQLEEIWKREFRNSHE